MISKYTEMPQSVIGRLTRYLAHVQTLCAQDIKWISSQDIADNLGLKFFDYALTLRDQRAEIDKNWAQSAITNAIPKPWPAGFRKPEFVGDYLNQEVFPYDKQGMVPEALRVPLPTKTISEAWNK